MDLLVAFLVLGVVVVVLALMGFGFLVILGLLAEWGKRTNEKERAKRENLGDVDTG